MPQSVSPGTTVWVTVAGCEVECTDDADRWAGCRLGEQLHHRRWGDRRSAADHSVRRVGTTELTEDQNGGDQGGHGAGADQMGAATRPSTTDLVDEG